MNPSEDRTLSEDAVAALDQFLTGLQSGESLDRVALLARFPELAGAVDSLEALEKLAPKREASMPTETNGPGRLSPSQTPPLVGEESDAPDTTPRLDGIDFGQYEV